MAFVSVSDRPSARAADAGRPTNRLQLLRELEKPAQVFANLTPNWFASVMGTGIIAVATAIRPVQLPGLHLVAVTLWASTGALLVPHASAEPARLMLLLGCYALFGLSLAACVRLIPVICRELAGPSVGPARLAPTVWIVLGPLGQSVTAANLLGGAAQLALPAPCARVLRHFGLVFGLPVWGLAALWVPLALAITVRTARSGLPFSLAWWSFTFPVGTCVTASTGLWLHTGAEVFRIAAIGLFVTLLLIWLAVSALTAAASWSGALFRGGGTALSQTARSA